MGMPAEARTGLAPQGLSQPLHNLFLAVAEREGYEQILACVLAAEWMYMTWCLKADQTPSSRAYIRDWVALHAGGAFAEQVAWVRSQIVARGSELSDARQARLMELFKQALAAEVKFHDAVYAPA
jgi:thiaminase/transcriptional activator TenA